ncbi:MAG TPA: GWxTD domain-containing protein [Caldithrix sp.]|nr:GWxTD domain-containing protein [Caldithrix sp.]
MKSFRFSFILFLLTFTGWIFPVEGTSSVKLSMDFGRFRYDDSSVYLEVYYSVYAQNIEYQNTAEGLCATTTLNFDLLDAIADSILAKDQINIKFSKNASDDVTEAQGSTGILKLILPKGKYRIRMYHGADTLSNEVSVTPFKSDKVTLSDLELSSNIITRVQDKENPFYKNTMLIMPNPSLIFGESLPRLYYYLEMYNLQAGTANPEDKLLVQVVIADSDGKVRLKKEYHRTHKNESSVEFGAFNVRRLESGLYTLIFAVTDSANNVTVYRRRNFYVYNPDVVLAREEESGEQYINSEFKNLPETTLDQMFAQARYVATSSEISVYKILNTLESKRQFLFKFWKSRNQKKPGWKDEYYQRVRYASEHFRVGTMEGWQSDMGRVYILYGPASEEKHFPSGPDENPYEIWYYYDIEGGVEFDFVDLNGFGIYRLVNSTKRDEVTYPDWQNYIYTR